jgi:peptide chain release factor 1
VNLTLYKLNEAMDGDLNEIIATLQAEDQAAMLAAIGDDAA